jgi:hypothetical protein
MQMLRYSTCHFHILYMAPAFVKTNISTTHAMMRVELSVNACLSMH